MDDYECKDDLLFYKGKVWVPSTNSLRISLIKHFYDSRFGGHFGIYRTWSRLAQIFVWTRMKAAVCEYIAQCDTCQQVKSDSQKPSGLLQPLPIPENIWEDVTMDFIECLPMSNG